MAPISLFEIQSAVEGRLRTSSPLGVEDHARTVNRVVVDSREVLPGDVFWALRGARRDGAEFAAEAFQRGAVGVVAQAAVCEPPAGCWTLQVDDSLAALWSLAAWVRNRFRGKVAAVTGSVGKTTTRQMIDSVLSSTLTGTASPRNYNNHVGVPLSLLALDPSHDYAVVEIGASAPGEIARLAELVRPDVAVWTTVGQAHLEGFGDQRRLAQSKAELLAALPEDGLAVLNGDDPWIQKLAAGSNHKKVWVGRQAVNDLAAYDVSYRDGRLSFTVDRMRYTASVWGRHHVTSALCAVAVGRVFGLTSDQISAGLRDFDPPPMRCQVQRCDDVAWIHDAYNASPSSMQAALELLREFDHRGRKIVAVGDMRELGSMAGEYHRRLGDQAATLCGADYLAAHGQYASRVVAAARAAGMPAERAVVCETLDDMCDALRRWLGPGDAVLLKGSRAMEMEHVFEEFVSPTAPISPRLWNAPAEAEKPRLSKIA